MEAILDVIAANPIRTAVLFVVVIFLGVLVFGPDRVWGAIKRVYDDHRGGSACIAVILLSLAGCVDPVAVTRESIERGDNAAAAAAAGGAQAYRNLVTSCLFLDAPEIRLGVDAVARSAGLSEAIAAVRAEREVTCKELGGWAFTREAAED